MKKILMLGGALFALAGVPSAQAAIVNYNVTTTFYEPNTQPRDTIFIGSFAFDSDTNAVMGLHGVLSESMTGDPIAYPNDNMTWLTLSHQLSSIPVTLDGADGLLVTTFLNNSTNTLYTGLGGDGWTPGTAQGLYNGFPGANPGNAYAMIFVNTTDPMAPLTTGQINKLAYADCSPGGMMSAVCMTGTTVAGWGELGSMSGYPVSQSITVVPLPGALGLLLSGLASLGMAHIRRRGVSK